MIKFNYEILIYGISLLASVFAISGINFEKFVKNKAVWETRVLSILMILGLAYIVANFIIGMMSFIKA